MVSRMFLIQPFPCSRSYIVTEQCVSIQLLLADKRPFFMPSGSQATTTNSGKITWAMLSSLEPSGATSWLTAMSWEVLSLCMAPSSGLHAHYWELVCSLDTI